MVSKCPGQDTQFWGPGDIYTVECPKCGSSVEFFKDDIRRRCRKCGYLFLNPKLDLGCARWCQYAEQCVGAMSKDEFKEVITLAMKGYFDGEKEKIDHSLKVLDFAERVMEQDRGNPKVVIAAATLYDIGMGEAGKSPEGLQGTHVAEDQLAAVRRILESSGSNEEVIEEVCRILEDQRNPERIDTLNSKIVYDARRLADGPDRFESLEGAEFKRMIDSVFFTAGARKIAEDLYAKK
jgi:Zn ribbon nucleic-acid-binding protein